MKTTKKRKKKANLSLRYKKIANLATKALNHKLESKPEKGKRFLEDLPAGTIWETSNLSGIKLNDSINPVVLIYDYRSSENFKNKSYYLGKHSFAGKTEVTVLTMGDEQ